MGIGQRIKWARGKRDMSRKELARVSGVPYPTLAGIENDDQESSTKLHAIAGALRANPEWLDTGKGEWDADIARAEAMASAPLPQPDELGFALAFLAQAVAAARPDAGEAFLEAFEKLPESVRGRTYMEGLAGLVRSEISKQGMLHGPTPTASGGRKRP